jgi:hypothetical protein
VLRQALFNQTSYGYSTGVAAFALKRRLAIMAAHDSILAARVKQTRSANGKRQESPFSNGDLVYLSTKNIKFEKGLARKLRYTVSRTGLSESNHIWARDTILHGSLRALESSVAIDKA